MLFFIMSPITEVEALRLRLSKATGVKAIARKTGLSYSWLMQFRHGKILNPTVRSIDILKKFFDACSGSSAIPPKTKDTLPCLATQQSYATPP